MKSRVGWRRKLYVTAGQLFVVATLLVAALPIAANGVCVCLNNASVFDIDANTGGADGQFSERILINAPAGQTWTVTAATGAFDAFNIPPVGMQSALVPVLPGVLLMPGPGMNQYFIDIVHIDSVGYTMTVMSNTGVSLTISNTCNYPDPFFVPPIASLYKNTDPAVTLGAQAPPPGLVGATFTIDGTPQVQLVPAFYTPVPATHSVELTATGAVGFAPNFPGCEQRVRKAFAIANPTPVPLMDARFVGALVMVLLVCGSRMLRRT